MKNSQIDLEIGYLKRLLWKKSRENNGRGFQEKNLQEREHLAGESEENIRERSFVRN